MKKTTLLVIVSVILAISSGKAATVNFNSGPLSYIIDTETAMAEVTGLAKYETIYDLVIPDYIEYNGNKYPVTSIKERAFISSPLKGSLTIGNNVTTIGRYAFYGCSGFTGSLTIPNSVTSIGDRAFMECSGFTGSLTIGDSVTTIGRSAFYGCSGFTGSLTIPNSVTSIGEYAFTRCSGFTGSLTISNSVTSIGECTFSGCSGFTGSLTIPNSVTSIGMNAFWNCSGFTGSLTIGDSVTTIGALAFWDTKFTDVTSLAEKPAEAGGMSFDGLYDSPLYVPEESINRYKNANEWKNFKYINPISISATSISLNKSELVLFVGEDETLIASLEPESSTAEVIWSVKEEYQNIISVDSEGKVTALAVGEAIVEATAGSVTATCKVTVTPVPASSVTLNVQDITLLVGATDKLTATVSPENVTNKAITWSSDNESIATVDADGNVTAVAVGVANITAKCGDATATCKVTVNPVPASSVTLNVQDITLLVGATDKLTATVSPENVTDPVITWSSDNESIATVDTDGNVTAVAVGVANITATCGDVTATCKVTVNPVPASSVTLNVQDITLLVGATDKLTATVSPENVTNPVITWTSDNESIATVDANGNVTAVAVGVANITAKCGDVTATCKVTVNPVPASSVTLNVQDITLLVGATDKLTATVSPENVTNKVITWSSDNESIATVDADGNVTAVAVGVANITAKCGDATATCKVTVNPVPVSSVTLNVQDITLLVGATDKLTATVSPENVTNPVITWASDNESIATIDANGNVTAVAVGVANITAKCGDVTATCKVTVNPVPASSVTLNVQDITLLVGATDKLTATVSPENVTEKVITWSSDNESIATVDTDGNVTAVAVGVANITAKCGDVTATCKVTVESLAERPEAPTQMLRKGNGTSCTFIAMMALTDTEIEQEGYSFVYGYTDASGNDNVIARTNVRYCHTTPAVYNNSGNDFWVFTVRVDDNGEMIGSERRHLDGSVDDDYDLAALLGRSRGIDGSDPDSWITATSRGALITVESADAVVVTVCSLGGQVVMRQETAAGTMVSQEINGDIIAPNVYVIRVDCGGKNVSKKVIIR